jgi:hypothetical protein
VPTAVCLILITFSQSAPTEREHCARLAPKYGAQTEVRLDDGTFCDLVNDEYAIEVDYPRKWAESIGQSLHYAELLGKKPAIILLLSNPEKEWQFLVRAARLAGKYNIRLYVEVIPPRDRLVQGDIVGLQASRFD